MLQLKKIRGKWLTSYVLFFFIFLSTSEEPKLYLSGLSQLTKLTTLLTKTRNHPNPPRTHPNTTKPTQNAHNPTQRIRLLDISWNPSAEKSKHQSTSFTGKYFIYLFSIFISNIETRGSRLSINIYKIKPYHSNYKQCILILV